MKKFDYIQTAKKIFEIESRVVSELSDQLNDSFSLLCEEVLNMNGKLILMGIGKSGHVSQKIAATLSSTGTASFFIHPTEAAHGDMGMIGKNDMVLLFSNSGETQEIISILPALKRTAKKLISVTGNALSSIAKASDNHIEIKTSEEACSLDLAPTSSTTSVMAFGDALAVTLLQAKGFTKDDFAKSHPAGKLGKALTLLVSDVMHSGVDMPKVNSKALLSDALLEITEKSLGMTLVEDNNKIVGIFTDGDLRRCISNKVDINQTLIKDVMTPDFKSIQSKDLAINAAKVMEDNKIFTLVVFKTDNAIGVLSMHDLLKSGIV
ncbi:KpsF/GutQ family sugar-phosphate isomerase [Gammaproteobacteria bacterium]|nr:KpsF/GutQ family sugar-phosphate isomerase [Gammaproteobacteria bacterium]